MKHALFLLSAATFLTGCVVYSPSPTTGNLGYTYDFTTPIAEGLAVAPRPHVAITEPAGATVVADNVPEPPRTPPIYSDMPEPPKPRVTQTTRTVIVPSAPVIREPAGATPTPLLQQQAAPAAQVPVPGTVIFGGTPFPLTNINTNMTNIGGTNIGGTNVGGTNLSGSTNIPIQTNAFGPLPGTNAPSPTNQTIQGFTNTPPATPPLNEPAGAAPQLLPVQPRLPAQPRIPSTAPGAPSGSFFPLPTGTATPNAIQQQQQQQQQLQPQAAPAAQPAPSAPAPAPAPATAPQPFTPPQPPR